MVKKGKISEYRERLDTTLASPELTNDDSLKILVRNQLLRFSVEKSGCSESVVERKTAEVSYFLDMLRSAAAAEHREWKLKDDNEEYRVMYRPGPHGTPLHTLLVEGYIDGPLDNCLCVSWESTLYHKWWPQVSFPPFKITASKCLQRVHVGEQISLIRVKVTWPLSAREVVVHYFLFEYLKDGLVIALVNSISDSDSIDTSTHGFTRDGIPEADDVVRIDVVGGFAIQKMNLQRSFIRTIATMDVKLDFVPPSLINFISRQLIGSGFKLYQKAVAKVSNYDEDYSKVLEDRMYANIRETLYSADKLNGTTNEKVLKNDANIPVEEHSIKDTPKRIPEMELKGPIGENGKIENSNVVEMKIFGEIEEDESGENKQLKDDQMIEFSQNTSLARDRKLFGEIEEEETEDSIDLESDDESIGQILTTKIPPNGPMNHKASTPLSPQVEQALATLEKAISLVRQRQSNSIARFSASKKNPNPQKSVKKDSSFVEDGEVSSDSDMSVEAYEKRRTPERKIAPATLEFCLPLAKEGNNPSLHSPNDGVLDTPIEGQKQMTVKVNDVNENGFSEEKKLSRQKNRMICCFRVNRR